MSIESTMRQDIIKVLRKFWMHPQAIENSVGTGVPDVNYVQGWVELKALHEWPKRAATPVRIDHFTPQQRIWLRNRWMAGGAAYLLLKVDGEYLLFTGAYAADHVGNVPRMELINNAVGYWPKGLDEKELVTCLKTTPQLS